MFGDTAYGTPYIVQTNENMLRCMACLSTLYADKYNVGFMDFRKSEYVFEAYDHYATYGLGAPYLLIFKDGMAYHGAQGSTPAEQLYEMVNNPEGYSKINETIKESRSELTIFWEYAKKDLGNYQKLSWLQWDIEDFFSKNEHVNTTVGPWIRENIIDYYFRERYNTKRRAQNIIFMIFVPAALLALCILRLILKIVCWILCCCGSSKKKSVDQADKKKTGGKGGREKID